MVWVFSHHMFPFVLLFLVISSGWIIAIILMHKKAFPGEFFIQQVYNRATSTEYGTGVNEARSLTGGILFIGRQTRDMPTIRNRRKQLISHA